MHIYFIILLIFVGWLVFLPVSLYLLSENIWVLGVYHNLEDETLSIKIKKVFSANVLLSFPIITSFYIVIKNTVQNFDNTYTFILALVISLVAVLSIRLLSNPSNIIKPAICKFFLHKKESDLILQHKERMLSFFYSFICAALIILFIIFSANMFTDNIYSVPPVSFQSLLIAIISYGGGLFIITCLGEYILCKLSPIDRIKCL